MFKDDPYYLSIKKLKIKIETLIGHTRVTNQYSPFWFDIFLSRDDDLKTRKEVQFILSQIRIGENTKVLDIACGNGRHARKLVAHGFEIFGIDVNQNMIEKARSSVPEGNFKLMDMKNLDDLKEDDFDLVLIMWQSFGYFDDQTNLSILESIFHKMREGGIFILDIYNKEFFENHQGIRKIETNNQVIEETKFVKNHRLEVHLKYQGNIDSDTFNWRIYGENEFIDLVEMIGFKTKTTCTNFDKNSKPDPSSPRIQYVLQKPIT